MLDSDWLITKILKAPWLDWMIVPTTLNFQKSKTIGRFVCFQRYYKGKLKLEPCFQLLKINVLGQFEKFQQVYLSEKEGEAISAIRTTVIHDAENLGWYQYLKPNLAMKQLWIRSSTSVIEYVKVSYILNLPFNHSLLIEMPSLNRNERVACLECGREYTFYSLAGHNITY